MNRRDVLKGAAAVAVGPTWGDKPPRVAGSLPAMRPDQALQAAVTRAGSGPAPASPVIVARRIIIIGPNGSLLAYNQNVGAGNLVDSIAAVGFTDTAGNVVLAGQTSYRAVVGGFEAAQNFGGALTYYTATSEAGPWTAIGFLQPFGGATTTTMQLGTPPGGSVLFQNGAVVLRPSGDATGVTDTASIGAAFGGGKFPLLMPGSTWFVNCGDATLTGLGVNQWIVCAPGVTINALGSGDLFNWSFSGTYSGNTTVGGGLLGYPMIDGTSTTGSATAVHAGDIESMRFEANARHFKSGTASWGFLFDNQNHFTERLFLDINAIDCGNTPGNGGHVGFNVSGAGLTSTSSFKGLSGRIRISQSQGTNQQDGLVLMNGARLYDCTRIEMTGNFTASGGATTAAAVRITGQVPAGHPDAGVFSQINTSHLVWTPECAAGANPPTTIVFGTPGSNLISQCEGLINFSRTGGASFAAAGNAAIQSFQFDGPVYGDVDLMRIALGGHQHYDQASLANGGTIITRTTGVVRIAQAALAAQIVLQQPLLTGEPSSQALDIWNTGTLGSGHDIQFDIPANSFVAGGTNVVIKAGFGQRFVWDYNNFLWFTV